MLSAVGFSPNWCVRCPASASAPARMPPSASADCFVPLQVSWLHHSKLDYIHIYRASSEGVPNELVEDPKFVPLNAADSIYGPPALLLLGFEADEALKIQQFLKELDGEFLKVIYCTKDMVMCSLWEAIHTTQHSLEEVEIDDTLPRICFLSGLSGEEMMMFIDAFPETGLRPAVFAALVPNSAHKPLQELIEEIMGDHEMLTGEKM